MPDRRRHRGLDPEDPRAFAPSALPALRAATADMSLLLGRGYTSKATLKLVGDRFELTRRQRDAVLRAACPAVLAAARRATVVPPGRLRGAALALDGFNVLTTLEVALGGGIVIVAMDGALRDIAGVHGTHRLVEESRSAIELLSDWLIDHGVGPCTFLFDRPVSNSGRAAQLVRDVAAARGQRLEAVVVDSPDHDIPARDAIAATADGIVIDRCARWCNLAREVVAARVPGARVIDLG